MDELLQFFETYHIGTIIVAVALFFITSASAHYVTKVVRRTRAAQGKLMAKGSLAENIFRGLIWATGLSLILAYCFEIDVDGLIAALGVGGVALSLGFKDTLSNIIGGVQITSLGILQLGDHVIINGTEGVVLNVSWRHTTMRDFERVVHVIPNSKINASRVEKFVPTNQVETRIAFSFSERSLDEMASEVERLAKEAVSEVAELVEDPEVHMTMINDKCTFGIMTFVLKELDNAREARDAALRAALPYAQQV